MANKNHNIYLIFSRYLKNHPVLRLAGGPAQQQRGLTRTMARQQRWIQGGWAILQSLCVANFVLVLYPPPQLERQALRGRHLELPVRQGPSTLRREKYYGVEIIRAI